jgi:hypothetical protein
MLPFAVPTGPNRAVRCSNTAEQAITQGCLLSRSHDGGRFISGIYQQAIDL